MDTIYNVYEFMPNSIMHSQFWKIDDAIVANLKLDLNANLPLLIGTDGSGKEQQQAPKKKTHTQEAYLIKMLIIK